MYNNPIIIKRILFATDLSESAKQAFFYAASLSNQYHAKLSIIHVIDSTHSLDERIIEHISKDAWEKIKKSHLQEARQVLIGKMNDKALIHAAMDQLCEDATSENSEFQVEMDEIIVRRGHPVEEIIKASEESKADIIVMGSHGHGTLKDSVLGGTSRRILRRANKPVLLVKYTE